MIEFTVKQEAINSDDFNSFLNRLSQQVDDSCTLVTDQHPIHTQKRTLKNFESMKSEYLFLPSYSSPLSAIEVYWSVLK
jgi:transposase